MLRDLEARSTEVNKKVSSTSAEYTIHDHLFVILYHYVLLADLITNYGELLLYIGISSN